MVRRFFKPEGAWVGDLIPFGHDGKFYLYYLNDKRIGRDADDYADRTTWNLLISEDGLRVEDKGVVLADGGIDRCDRSCYTGSVVRATDGGFHMFYTGQNNRNPRFMRGGKPVQYILHATSEDLIHWEKHYEMAFTAEDSAYELQDWRDPFVFFNEEEGCYNMLLAARKAGSSSRRGGCIARCTSDDLIHWTIGEPFYAPEAYLTHECPDLFKMGDWWYLVYSTFSERFETHYRMARSLNGPWTAPVCDTFDARAFYAAKTAEVNGRRYAFAWIPTKRGDSDFGQWEWGGCLAAHEIWQDSDGALYVKPTPAMLEQFPGSQALKVARLEKGASFEGRTLYIRARDRLSYAMFGDLPECFTVEADISYSQGIRSFGLGIRFNDEIGDGYNFRVEPSYNRVVFDMWPRRAAGVNQWYIDGDKPFQIELERPLKLDGQGEVRLKLVAERDVCVLYVNSTVALSTRAYNVARTLWGFFAQDGEIAVNNIRLGIE